MDGSDEDVASRISDWFEASRDFSHVAFDDYSAEPGDKLAELVEQFLYLSNADNADDREALESRAIGAVVNCIAGVRGDADAAYFAETVGHSVQAICDIDAQDEWDYPLLANHLEVTQGIRRPYALCHAKSDRA